jgi:sec-independent protein translocase protein TatB
MANLGMADTIILMVMALVVFGPRRLPQIGRQIGKLMYEFRKASNDFKFQMEEELRLAEDADRRKKEETERQRVAALAPPVSTPVQTIEAQADIGALEWPTASQDTTTSTNPDASPYPGEGQYPETAVADSEPVINIPRIQPPSTGQQVIATPPGYIEPVPAAQVDTPAVVESAPNSEFHPSKHIAESAQLSDVETPNPPSEPVSQHG